MGKVYLGSRMSNLDTGEPSTRISRVNLLVDSENMYTAGDDSGRTIERTCPWATQAMADSILARLRNVDYRPYSGLEGLLDPAAEVGDGITVGDAYSVLAQTDILFDALCSVDVSAPGGDEAEDEYPYRPRARRQSDRELAQVRSSIKKTAEEIRLLVEDTANNISSDFSVKLDSITSTVTGHGSQISSIKQYVDNITLSVSNGSTSSTITLKSGSATIASREIKMDGLVTLTGLSGGTTTINGACIKTGTIDAARLNLTGAITFSDLNSETQGKINDTADSIASIKGFQDGLTLSVSNGSTSSTITLKSGSATIASKEIKMDGLVTFTGLSSGTTAINGACIKTGTIDAARLNLTGAITFSDLNTTTQNKINTASTNASSALTKANTAQTTVSGWTYSGTTMIDGSKIVAGTIIAGSLQGGEVQLLTANSEAAGTIQIEKSYIAPNGRVDISAGELTLQSTAYNSSLYLAAGGGTSFTMLSGNEIMVGATMYPLQVRDLGTSRSKWNDIYLVNDPIVISDREKKTGIAYGLDAYDALFNALRPASYKLTSGQSGRTHLGLIAQDVEQAMTGCGVTSIDFAGFVKSPRMDDKNQIIEDEYDYALRYGEFTALCIYQIQKLKAQVAALERRLAS